MQACRLYAYRSTTTTQAVGFDPWRPVPGVDWPGSPSGGKRQLRIQARTGAGRAVDGDRPAERLDPVFQPH
jgi:hypothetical protein